MNYQKVYSNLIRKAVGRGYVDGYSELHHIVPKFAGGDNSKQNLVRLTAREHYIAHWLLYKIHRTKEAFFSWHCMSMDRDGNRYTSHTFSYSRAAWAKHMSEVNKGRKHSEETKVKISESKLGTKPWNVGVSFTKRDSKQKVDYLSDPKMCKFCGEFIPYAKRLNTYCNNSCAHSDPDNPKNSRDIRRKANSGSFKDGHKVDDDTRRRISNSMSGVKRDKVSCPHCGKTGDVSLMKRWHFENCKIKGD